MAIIHIDKLLYPMGNGATNPIRGIVNNKEYVIKTFNNVEGNKVLINELIGYRLAKQLDLPVPNALLGVIDENTYIDENVRDLEDFNEDCYGIAFCSELLYPVAPIASNKIIKMSTNYKWLIPKLILFDHLIYNKDRNKGNLLMSLSKNNKQLYVIDHSHIYNLEAIWNSVGLKQKMEDCDFNDENIMSDNWYLYSKFKDIMDIDMVEMEKALQYFKEKLNLDFFNHIIDNIPDVWENNKSELKALSEYLIYRMEHLGDYINIILSYTYNI